MAIALQKALARIESGAAPDAYIRIPGQTTSQGANTGSVLVNPVGRAASPALAPIQVNPTAAMPAATGGYTGQVSAGKAGVQTIYWIGGGLAILSLIVICLVAVYFAAGNFLPGKASEAPSLAQQASDTPAPAEATSAPASATLAVSPTDTNTPEPSATPGPTDTPTPAFPPTVVVPAGVPFVRINKIELDAQNRYVVSYETFEYTEKLPGVHVHFFFNTVTPDQAGSPGKGPWILYGGPRPFTGYKTSDRPEQASQMCALVANANHSVQPDSGNCLPLPDVPSITTRTEVICRGGPGEAYDNLGVLKAGVTVLLRGLAEDELWLYVQSPFNLEASCWAPTTATFVQGDISQLHLVEAPPTPTPNALSAEITNITLDQNGQFVVDFVTHNFEPVIPGIHLHFFFDTTPAVQVGIGGGGLRKMFGGASPFTGYTALDQPDGATQLCVIVANADHSIIPNSGNCFTLPTVPPAVLDRLNSVSPTPTSAPAPDNNDDDDGY